MQLSDRWALITGASSGLGSHFAEQLAAAGMHLALTARRGDRLEALAARLRIEHGVEVHCVPADLATVRGPADLHAELQAAGIDVHLLVNNAGFGWNGRFADMEVDRAREQLQLNALALTELTSRCLPAMRKRREGFVLNVSSIQAFMSVPGYATYAATKAYIRHFSEALHDEEKSLGVTVTCLCPGPTVTEFYDVAGHDLPPIFRSLLMQPSDVVRQGLGALFAGKRTVIPGVMNKVIVAQLRSLPKSLHLRVAGQLVAGLANHG